jgi:hypothetical protein
MMSGKLFVRINYDDGAVGGRTVLANSPQGFGARILPLADNCHLHGERLELMSVENAGKQK